MLTISYLSGFGKDPDLVCFSSKPLLSAELLNDEEGCDLIE